MQKTVTLRAVAPTDREHMANLMRAAWQRHIDRIDDAFSGRRTNLAAAIEASELRALAETAQLKRFL